MYAHRCRGAGVSNRPYRRRPGWRERPEEERRRFAEICGVRSPFRKDITKGGRKTNHSLAAKLSKAQIAIAATLEGRVGKPSVPTKSRMSARLPTIEIRPLPAWKRRRRMPIARAPPATFPVRSFQV